MLAWRLKSLFLSLWNIHHNVFWCGVGEILHFFRSQTCDICCLWLSPQSISGTRTVSFQLPEKNWKYFCVVRWISRLFSLQCSPWIPRVPLLRLLLAHAFYLCQENMKLNVFLTIAFHLVSLTCPLSFLKNRRATRLNSVPGSVVGDVKERRKEKVFLMSCFLLVSFFLCCKSKETNTILSTELNLWLVIFATSASSLNCGSPSSLAHGWNGRYRYITLMYLLFTLWASIQSDIGVLCMLCICMAYLETTASGLSQWIFSPVGLKHCWVSETLMASSPRVK